MAHDTALTVLRTMSIIMARAAADLRVVGYCLVGVL